MLGNAGSNEGVPAAVHCCRQKALSVAVQEEIVILLSDIRTVLQDKSEPPVYVSDRRLVKAVAIMQVDSVLLLSAICRALFDHRCNLELYRMLSSRAEAKVPILGSQQHKVQLTSMSHPAIEQAGIYFLDSSLVLHA